MISLMQRGACLLILLSGAHLLVILARVSFTANGEWGAEAAPATCNEHHMCSPNKLTWYGNYTPNTVFNNITGCEMLNRKGITKMDFHGDSYMRHMHQAILITLRGDYLQGALNEEGGTENYIRPAECVGTVQFYGKTCVDPRPQSVCDGKVTLHYRGWENTQETSAVWQVDISNELCHKQKGQVHFISVGNHAAHGQKRQTANNFWTWRTHFNDTVCPKMRGIQYKPSTFLDFTEACSIWWVSTHARFASYHAEEAPPRVLEYNVGMRDFFDTTQNCGPINYVDVYNMTEKLLTNHREEAKPMTYDLVHWSMEVNLIKAQILLNALESSSSKRR